MNSIPMYKKAQTALFYGCFGWASLLGTEKLDFILVLLLVVAGTGFAYEYESGMMDTLGHVVMGDGGCINKDRLYIRNMHCHVSCFESVDFADALIRYGPLHGSYPIQSAKCTNP